MKKTQNSTQQDHSHIQINHNTNYIQQIDPLNDNIQKQQQKKPQHQNQSNQEAPLSPDNKHNSHQQQTPSTSNYNQKGITFNKKELLCLIFSVVFVTLILIFALASGAYFIFIKGYIHDNSSDRTNSFLIANQQSTPYTSATAEILQNQTSVNWVNFDTPIQTDSFKLDYLKESIISFKSVIANQTKARYIKLIVYNYAGWAGADQFFNFWIKTRVINGNKEWIHWNYGTRHPQDAITYNSQELIVPCSQTRQIRVWTNTTQINGGIRYFIAGYTL